MDIFVSKLISTAIEDVIVDRYLIYKTDEVWKNTDYAIITVWYNRY